MIEIENLSKAFRVAKRKKGPVSSLLRREIEVVHALNDVSFQVKAGNITYELIRPINLYSFWYTKLLSTRLASAALRCLPIIAIILGVMISVAISMFIYISVFITLSPIGSLLLFNVVGEFLSGLVIPIPLMPIWLKNLLMFLPFRYTADLPLRIYSGNVGLNEAVFGIGIHLIWLIMLPIVGNHLMNKAMKHFVVQGG